MENTRRKDGVREREGEEIFSKGSWMVYWHNDRGFEYGRVIGSARHVETCGYYQFWRFELETRRGIQSQKNGLDSLSICRWEIRGWRKSGFRDSKAEEAWEHRKLTSGVDDEGVM
jgi:hypothetical protein